MAVLSGVGKKKEEEQEVEPKRMSVIKVDRRSEPSASVSVFVSPSVSVSKK